MGGNLGSCRFVGFDCARITDLHSRGTRQGVPTPFTADCDGHALAPIAGPIEAPDAKPGDFVAIDRSSDLVRLVKSAIFRGSGSVRAESFRRGQPECRGSNRRSPRPGRGFEKSKRGQPAGAPTGLHRASEGVQERVGAFWITQSPRGSCIVSIWCPEQKPQLVFSRRAQFRAVNQRKVGTTSRSMRWPRTETRCYANRCSGGWLATRK